MIKSGIGLICLLMVVGCGKENIPSTEESQILENHRLPQPMKKDRGTPLSSEVDSATTVNPDRPIEKKVETELANKGVWVVKRKTDEFGAFIGPIQIESEANLFSQSGDYKLGFEVMLAGDLNMNVNRADGNDVYESTKRPAMLSRRYAGREAQNDSFERYRQWEKDNAAMVTVSVKNGESKTEKLRLLNNRIHIGTNNDLNTFLKQCFYREAEFSISIKTTKLSQLDSTFKDIKLNGYKQKTDELRTILGRNKP